VSDQESDPKLGFGTNHCKCSVCGEYFTNVTNFDMHRRGTPTARYCVHPSKVTNRWGKAKLHKNAKGLWARTGGAYMGGRK